MFTKTISGATLATLLLTTGFQVTHASQSAANTLAANGVITTSTDYRLKDTITRKEMMKIVMNLSGKSVPNQCSGNFADVQNDWGCKYIEAALVNGFIARNASFRPDDTITKAESIKLIAGARGISKAQDTGLWQVDWMNSAYNMGILSEKYSDHNSNATRGWIFDLGAAEKGSLNAEIDAMHDNKADPNDEVMMKKSGVYTDYSEDLLGSTESTVLFFHASWCPSCRATDSSLLGEDVASSGITILKIDFDSNTDLRQKYGVTSQHTFIQVDSEGELIKKWIGSSGLTDIQENLQ